MKSISDELAAVGVSLSAEFSAIIFHQFPGEFRNRVATVPTRSELVSFYEFHSLLASHEIPLNNT